MRTVLYVPTVSLLPFEVSLYVQTLIKDGFWFTMASFAAASSFRRSLTSQRTVRTACIVRKFGKADSRQSSNLISLPSEKKLMVVNILLDHH